LLSGGLSIELVPPPHFFVLLLETLLKHFDLEAVFLEVRDEDTP
jgi:hypothetical protein